MAQSDAKRVEVAGSIPAHPTESTWSVEAWAEVWASTLMLKPKTRLMYAGVVRTHILPTFAGCTLDGVSRLDVQRWVAQLAMAKSPSHVRNCHSVLRQMYTDAIANELVSQNPCVGIRLPKRVEQDKHPLTLDEVRAVAHETGRYEPFVLTLALLGLRWAEGVGLRPTDVQDGYVSIGSTLSEVQGRFHRVPTKNNKVRRLPVPGVLGDYLSPPFLTYHGNHIRNSMFREKIWYPALQRAGVRRVNVHSLRATCASELVKKGASVVLVSKWLGHSDPQVTLRRYSFIFQNDLQDIAEMVGR